MAAKKVTKKTKSKKVVPELVESGPPSVPHIELSIATKEYIATNFNKLPTADIATNTGLTEQQVLDYVHNVDRDVKASKKPNKYGAVKGLAKIFDEKASAGADIAIRNMPKPDPLKMYGKDAVPIVFKPGFGEE